MGRNLGQIKLRERPRRDYSMREYLWPGRFHEHLHILTRQYARNVRDRVKSIGLETSAYGTHSRRRTKVTQIYKKRAIYALCNF